MRRKSNTCGIHCLCWWVLWIGGINWGLIGLLEFDLIDALFGGWAWLTRLIYILVGLAAVALLFDKGKKKYR